MVMRAAGRPVELLMHVAAARRVAWPALPYVWPALAGVTLVYLVAGKVGLSLAFVHASATAVWPPTGIALAALLLYGYHLWPAIFVGAFLVNVTTSGAVPSSLGIATGNTLEALLGVWLVRRWADGREVFERARSIFAYAALVGGASTAISATVGVASLALGGHASSGRLGEIWLTWWLGDMAGAPGGGPGPLPWGGGPGAGPPRAGGGAAARGRAPPPFSRVFVFAWSLACPL